MAIEKKTTQKTPSRSEAVRALDAIKQHRKAVWQRIVNTPGRRRGRCRKSW